MIVRAGVTAVLLIAALSQPVMSCYREVVERTGQPRTRRSRVSSRWTTPSSIAWIAGGDARRVRLDSDALDAAILMHTDAARLVERT